MISKSSALNCYVAIGPALVWKLFGKRKERQVGIDILDVGEQSPIFAVQCKLREEQEFSA